jgi:hypothetical protein
MSLSSSFPYFADLPLKLRLIIWHLHIPGARMVKLYSKHINCVAGKISYYPRDCAISVRCTIPALLHVNRESRRVVAEIYSFFSIRPLGIHSLFFDPERDWLYFDDFHAFLYFAYFTKGKRGSVGGVDEEEQGIRVRNLATEVRNIVMMRPGFFSTTCGADLLRFPQLRTLIVKEGGYETAEKGVQSIERKFRKLRGPHTMVPEIRFLSHDEIGWIAASIKVNSLLLTRKFVLKLTNIF